MKRLVALISDDRAGTELVLSGWMTEEDMKTWEECRLRHPKWKVKKITIETLSVDNTEEIYP